MFKKSDIYILGSYYYPFRYKIGISNSTDRRKKEIKDSGVGGIFTILNLSIFFARELEQLLHAIYGLFGLNAKMKGSGKTEWFWMFFPVIPCCIVFFIWILQQAFWFLLIAGALYYFNQ